MNWKVRKGPFLFQLSGFQDNSVSDDDTLGSRVRQSLIKHIFILSLEQHGKEHSAAAAAAAKSLQSCLTLCDPLDGSPPGSLVPGILQARTRVGCHLLLQCIKVKSESEVTQSCLTLSDPMDCSPPSSSVHGIFQARVLEWVAIAFSKRAFSGLYFSHTHLS